MGSRIVRGLLACLFGAHALLPAHAAEPSPPPRVEVEGFVLDEVQTVEGQKLSLNGAAVQKRAFFKTNILALYLPQKARSLVDVLRMPGPKRLVVVMLREISGPMASRFYQSDLRQYSTDAELKVIGNEIVALGNVYAAMPTLNRGDLVVVDWVPGKGMLARVNGKVVGNPMTNPLIWEISLRVSLSDDAPDEVRRRMLGLIGLRD